MTSKDDIVKVCKKHGELTIDKVFIFPRCKCCAWESRALRRTENKEKTRETSRIYRQKHIDLLKVKDKKYRDANREKIKEKNKRWREKNPLYAKNRAKNLCENYVATALREKSNLKTSDIPPALIELKRIQFEIRREIRKLKQSQGKTCQLQM